MKSKSSTIDNFRRLVSIFPKKYLLILAIILTVLSSGFTIWISHLLKQVINIATSQESNKFALTIFTIGVIILVE